MSVITLATTG